MIKQQQLAGFTLLELMIATVLGAMLLLTASTLFMTFMIGNANTNARRQLSAEGIQMLGTLEYHIRNAKSAVCAGNNLTLTKLDGTSAQACFSDLNPIKLNFNSNGSCGSNPLNADSVISQTQTAPLVFAPYFTCIQAANGKQTVEIQFTLKTSDDSSITAPFSTIVQLRNS